MLLTIPNLLSLLRLLLFPPTAWLAWQGGTACNAAAAGLLLLMALTDILDGYLARHLHQRSEAGRVLDPLADKICVGGLFLILALRGRLPWWLAGMVIGRDALILLAGAFLLGRYGRVTESNWFGKTTVGILVATLVVQLVELEALDSASLVLAALGLAVSTVAYGWRFVRILTGKESPPEPAPRPKSLASPTAVEPL
ncbi:MAG: CDP-alcohol phosphatidyltransferase family protein [candidate division KSB1 bacterium]|nr:CDP-alcohol phosphatidyltransferase family protein [candidate division KSB1 bacterium]